MQSGQRQCLSDLILCEVTVSQIQEKMDNGKLVRIVTKREFTGHGVKKRAENLTKNSCYSPQLLNLGCAAVSLVVKCWRGMQLEHITLTDRQDIDFGLHACQMSSEEVRKGQK